MRSNLMQGVVFGVLQKKISTIQYISFGNVLLFVSAISSHLHSLRSLDYDIYIVPFIVYAFFFYMYTLSHSC